MKVPSDFLLVRWWKKRLKRTLLFSGPLATTDNFANTTLQFRNAKDVLLHLVKAYKNSTSLKHNADSCCFEHFHSYIHDKNIRITFSFLKLHLKHVDEHDLVELVWPSHFVVVLCNKVDVDIANCWLLISWSCFVKLFYGGGAFRQIWSITVRHIHPWS